MVSMKIDVYLWMCVFVYEENIPNKQINGIKTTSKRTYQSEYIIVFKAPPKFLFFRLHF
jgi:hypothetical protein